MSDLTPIRTVVGVREMVDVLRVPTVPGAAIKSSRYRVRIAEWLPEELQRFEADVEAGLL